MSSEDHEFLDIPVHVTNLNMHVVNMNEWMTIMMLLILIDECTTNYSFIHGNCVPNIAHVGIFSI